MSVYDFLTLSISDLHSIYGGAKKHKQIIEIEEYPVDENDLLLDDNNAEPNEEIETYDLDDDIGMNILDEDDEEIESYDIEVLGGSILDDDTIDGVTIDDFTFDEEDVYPF